MPVRARLRDGAPRLILFCLQANCWICLSQRSETTELLIVLSEAERQSLRAGLIEPKGHTIITQMLVDIDVEEAKAQQESDHRQLSVRTPSL